MPLKSLHQQLLQWLLTALILLILFNAWQSYDNADLAVSAIIDRTLIGSARTIAEQIKVEDGMLQVEVPPSALEMFASGYRDRVIYRVADAAGTLFAGYPDVPGPAAAEANSEPRFFDAEFRGQAIRAVALNQRLVGEGAGQYALVVVGETRRSHARTVETLWLDEMERQVALAVIAVALAWIGLNRGLAPLKRISAEIAQRPPEALDLIEEDRVQIELRPLVRTLNQAVERVRHQIAGQRRFIADAAHQLRSPLALMKTQASYGLGSDTPEDKDKALAALDKTVERMARVMNQLLVLAKIEPRQQDRTEECADLVAITRHVLEQNVDRSLARNIDLGFDARVGEMRVAADATLLHELVLNLVDNALRYVPSGGEIQVAVEAAESGGLLTVTDDGPGIPAEERDRVFDRFYRGFGNKVDGSGLGLAIVREILDRYGGTITLADPPSGRGLMVEVRLPAA